MQRCFHILSAGMRAEVLAILIVGITCLPSIARAQLTGVWQDDNGTRYLVRQSDDEVFWWMVGNERVQNVFHGTRVGRHVIGEWVDLPGGRMLGFGTLAVEVRTPDLMVRIGGRGNYGATRWQRIPVFIQPVDPTTTSTGTSPPQTGDKRVIRFRGPQHPLPEPPQYSGPSAGDRGMADAEIGNGSDLRFERLEWNRDTGADPALLCGSQTRLDLLIKNRGSRRSESGEAWHVLTASMTNYIYDEVNGVWTYTDENLITNSSGEIVIGAVDPGATVEQRLLIGPLANPFSVRFDLFRASYEGGRLVKTLVDKVTRSFRKSGPDLGDFTGQLYLYPSERKLEALAAVKNNGDLAPTSGHVTATIRIRQKAGFEHLPMIIMHLELPSPAPGEVVQGVTGEPILYLGEPDWGAIEVDLSWACKQDGVMSWAGMDKDLRDNRFIRPPEVP